MAKHQFQTEANQILNLMIHSLYSNKEIFLRELISNASDAIDKLNFLTVTDDKLKSLDFKPKIEIEFSKDGQTLIISDNGIGMNEDDLKSHLGTIAKSGTKSFLSNLTGDSKKDSNLIGQFGVGFYASFMVADKVSVISKKAGEDKASEWVSNGDGEYEINSAERDEQGTTIKLHLKDEELEFADRHRLETVIKKYSNHIAFPIFLNYQEEDMEIEVKEGEDRPIIDKCEQINSALALWTKNKSDISDDDYNEFYKTLSHDSENPLLNIHTKAEGKMEFTTLFYIPSKAPMDMYRVDYESGIKLYVKRVFITDDDKELLPTYLRFVKGIIDSQDLPLNVSREILQENKILANIKQSSTKKILTELKKLAKKDAETYTKFYEEFGKAMKEGLYSDHTNQEILLELVRYKSTKATEKISLKEYKENMKDDQKEIFYITGKNGKALINSPLLEAYRKNDIEVLIMDEEFDDIISSSLTKYKDIDIKNIESVEAPSSVTEDEKKELDENFKDITTKIKESLGEKVKNVVVSTRLNNSASCIVADKDDPMAQMASMMKAMGQEVPKSIPILEINPNHNLIKKLSTDDKNLEDISMILFEQALLNDGQTLENPIAFTDRVNKLLANI